MLSSHDSDSDQRPNDALLIPGDPRSHVRLPFIVRLVLYCTVSLFCLVSNITLPTYQLGGTFLGSMGAFANGVAPCLGAWSAVSVYVRCEIRMRSVERIQETVGSSVGRAPESVSVSEPATVDIGLISFARRAGHAIACACSAVTCLLTLTCVTDVVSVVEG